MTKLRLSPKCTNLSMQSMAARGGGAVICSETILISQFCIPLFGENSFSRLENFKFLVILSLNFGLGSVRIQEEIGGSGSQKKGGSRSGSGSYIPSSHGFDSGSGMFCSKINLFIMAFPVQSTGITVV